MEKIYYVHKFWDGNIKVCETLIEKETKNTITLKNTTMDRYLKKISKSDVGLWYFKTSEEAIAGYREVLQSNVSKAQEKLNKITYEYNEFQRWEAKTL